MLSQKRLEIAGLGFLFSCEGYSIKLSTRNELYMSDFVREGKNHIFVRIQVGNLPVLPKDKILFRAKENWRGYLINGKHVFTLYKSLKKPAKEKVVLVGVVNNKLSRCNLRISPESELLTAGKTLRLDMLVRTAGVLLTLNLLHRYQGLLIHASGVILNGEGIIFPGVSGAGKTTLARLWQVQKNAVVLNDDRVIVRRKKQGYFVYGNPWPGEGRIACAQQAPLKKIIFLAKEQINQLRTLNKSQVLSQLLATSIPAIWNKQNLDFSLKFVAVLARDIPAYQFGFVPDQSAIEFIAEKLSKK